MLATAMVKRLQARSDAASDHAALTSYLGPASVIDLSGNEVRVELPSGAPARARLALAFPYRPAPRDVLLVIGWGGAHYVIGVLEGTGESTLAFRGDVELRAEGGALSLVGDRGVHLRGPEVGIDAGRLRVAAESAVQKLGSLVLRVSKLWSVRAREIETIVDETSLTRAKSASILTEESMTINGKQIHLG